MDGQESAIRLAAGIFDSPLLAILQEESAKEGEDDILDARAVGIPPPYNGGRDIVTEVAGVILWRR